MGVYLTKRCTLPRDQSIMIIWKKELVTKNIIAAALVLFTVEASN
jgi:hypothetical protein